MIKNSLDYDIEIGAFSFRCQSPDDGKARWLLLDDRLPCKLKAIAKSDERNSEFIFCRSAEQGELWPSFLEKGFSKYCGCFQNIVGSNSSLCARLVPMEA